MFEGRFILENIQLLYPPTGNPWCGDCTTIEKPSLRINSADRAVTHGRSTCRASDDEGKSAEFPRARKTEEDASDVFCRQTLRDTRFVRKIFGRQLDYYFIEIIEPVKNRVP